MSGLNRSWVNGVPAESIPLDDRGLLYGDGLFETLAVSGGRVLRWDRHWERLALGCDRLAIPLPDRARVEAERDACLDGVHTAVLKLILTRGPGPRGYAPPPDPQPTRIWQCSPWPQAVAAARGGVTAVWCRTNWAIQPRLAGIKHLNRLEQVLARAEVAEAGAGEGLVCDAAGRLVSGTQSNVFWVRAGVLHTPDVAGCGVAGTVRAALIDAAAAAGTPVRVVSVEPGAIADADEVFLCNAVWGVAPVIRLGDRALGPGPAALRWRERLAGG